jgi:peptidoglycan/xylan/chitin deacetylase (PgdA/CDA1 family)
VAVPVLTYHAANVEENRYEANDHIALATDLRLLQRIGWQVVSLAQLLAWHQGSNEPPLTRCVAISFDDGTDFDFHDLPHPHCGTLRSFANILLDHQAATGLPVPAACFVVASPAARQQLDQRGLLGKGWWSDDWWQDAQRHGPMSIECHSWDHLHPDLDEVAQRDNLKGDFSLVDSLPDCDRQVRQAGDYIAGQLGGQRPQFFAYPWGQCSDYLADRYMPGHRHEHGFAAAFTTEAEAVTRAHSRWRLPRFVCGRDWQSTEQLAGLLQRVSA